MSRPDDGQSHQENEEVSLSAEATPSASADEILTQAAADRSEMARPGSGDPASGRAGTGAWAVIGSVFSAAFGVQSSQNRQRDFERGRPIHFIVGGLIGTVVFIVVVLLAVQAVLPS